MTSQDGVSVSKRAADFVRKVALDHLSLQVLPLPWLTYPILNKVDLSVRADVWCILLCCAARCRPTGVCGAKCVGACDLSEVRDVFSTRVVGAIVLFAEWCSYLDGICGC